MTAKGFDSRSAFKFARWTFQLYFGSLAVIWCRKEETCKRWHFNQRMLAISRYLVRSREIAKALTDSYCLQMAEDQLTHLCTPTSWSIATAFGPAQYWSILQGPLPATSTWTIGSISPRQAYTFQTAPAYNLRSPELVNHKRICLHLSIWSTAASE